MRTADNKTKRDTYHHHKEYTQKPEEGETENEEKVKFKLFMGASNHSHNPFSRRRASFHF
jgi:hypothetical protein